MNRAAFRVLRLVAFCAAEALILAGAWVGTRHETAAVNQAINEASDLRDPSPFRAALMGHLGKIHLGLEGYLRSPDPSLEKQIAESRKDFDLLLPEFSQQNPKLFPQAANDEIKRTFGPFKDVLDHTLEMNSRRMESRAALDRNFDRILYLIDHDLRPLIRREQADGPERADAVLNIENQMRAWHENLVQAWAQPSEATSARVYENENRGETYLELYSNMELLPRERKVLHEVRTLWQTNNDLSRESFVKENLVSQAEKGVDAERLQIVAVLNKFLPALPPAEMENRKRAILNAMRLHLTAAAGIGLLGLVSVVVLGIAIYRFVHAPAPVESGIFRVRAAEHGAHSAKEPTLQMDLKGTIAAWSQEAEALYGYSLAEMIGQSIGKLFESETEIARLGKELQKANRLTFETTHKTKSGTPLPVRIEFHTVSDASGRAAAISLSCSRR